MRSDAVWAWWQWLLAAALAVDLVGGVAANAVNTAKRFYHGPPPSAASPLQRLLNHPVGFTAAHGHPFVVAAAFPGGDWAWAIVVYAAVLASVVVVGHVPLYRARPVEFGLVALAVLALPLLPSPPPGLEWFAPVLVLELVLSHAVPEEPYRPA